MDTLVRDFDEALLSNLECPVCTDYMAPPIMLCCNGHNICSKCRKKVECCPTCKGQFSAIRNVALEDIARRQRYPCVNRDMGCSDIFPMNSINEHQAICRFGPMSCPLNKFPLVKCSWRGLLSEFKMHVREGHKEFYKDTSSIRSQFVGNGIAVRFVADEAFLCYKMVEEHKWYCVVQLVGTSEEASKYKCQYTLCGSNGVDKIVQTFIVRSFTEDFSESYQSGKCLILDDKVVRNFIDDGKLNLVISVSKIEK